MGFGGGGGQSSDDAMNQLVLSTLTSWITDVMNQGRQTQAAGEQAQAAEQQRAQQERATNEARQYQEAQAARDNEWRAREAGLLSQMNNMQASFSERMKAQSDYEAATLQRQQAEEARLAEEARREKILQDQKKQEEMRQARSLLWAGGFEGTKKTGGLGVPGEPTTAFGQALGSTDASPYQPWTGDGSQGTSVRGGRDQGILSLLTPNGMNTQDWLTNWVGVPKGQKPANSWVNEQYSAMVLGAGR